MATANMQEAAFRFRSERRQRESNLSSATVSACGRGIADGLPYIRFPSISSRWYYIGESHLTNIEESIGNITTSVMFYIVNVIA